MNKVGRGGSPLALRFPLSALRHLALVPRLSTLVCDQLSTNRVGDVFAIFGHGRVCHRGLRAGAGISFSVVSVAR
jgi:hypothetical protein